ncbi:MAG: hypothetical protein MUF64_00800 [Polyangiaceae bacterium]|nr:hypothetical protein [Polyangiaceae bacterium]
MNSSLLDPTQLRKVILEAIPPDLFDNPTRYVYLPPDIQKALDPSRPLVTGDRGTGKTFLWSYLTTPGGVALLNKAFAHKNHSTRVAFGATSEANFERPGQDTVQFLFQNAPARVVWKTFFLVAALDQPIPGASWSERVRWVQENVEASDLRLVEQDKKLLASGERRLILFDAVDRDPLGWSELVDWHGALLKMLLDVQHFRALKIKAFVRRDIMAAPEVSAFPDASKLRANEVELRWRQNDLFALLWRYLSRSIPFRQAVSTEWQEPMNIPLALRENEAIQKRIWHQIAGPSMGGPRRGDTYRWLFNHLADANQQVSPRSFLIAVRTAAEQTLPTAPTAIHFSAIQEGVKKAARARAQEIAEDFPWMHLALGALQKALVPCARTKIIEAWEGANLEARMDEQKGRQRRSHGRGLDALVDELTSLHIFHQLHDGRINVPDVFRLGFGMRRMGGVRPS